MVYKQHTCIFHSSGAWKSKIRALADLVAGEGLFSGSQVAVFSLGPHVLEISHNGQGSPD